MKQNTDSPLVTIGIPTFNRADSFLTESLESALAQTYPNLEVIVSDNCSSDQTEKVIKEYRDSRIRYFRHEPAILPHENAACCLRKAKGDYFLLLHDDDLIDVDFVEVCMEAIAGREVGFARTGAREIDGNGNVLSERINPHRVSTAFEYLEAVLTGDAVTYFCNTLYNTYLLKRIGGFRSRAFVYQDVIATIKIAGAYQRVDIEGSKASYRVHESKLGRVSNIAKWCEDSLEIIDVMCEKMPEREAFFKGEGMRLLCRRNYQKAFRVQGFARRFYAHLIVYKQFGRSPVSLFCERFKRKMAKVIGWRVQDTAV